MTSHISLWEIIDVAMPGPNIFLWIFASVADAVVVNPYGIKTFLANGLSTFPIKGNPVFGNGPQSIPTNPLDCPIIWNWVFHIFILADEPFAKALRSLETCVLVNNNSCGMLFSSLESPRTFDESYFITIFYSTF